MNTLKRRAFLKSSLTSLCGVTTASSLGLNLGMMSSAYAGQKQFKDYKALVCVFLLGGNDSFNMLVPTDNSDYKAYKKVRQNMAYRQDVLLPIKPKTSVGYDVGMPKAMEGLQSLFEQKKLAFVANTGPLVQPVTKKLALASPANIPPQLFSHNDQQKLWQSALPNSATNTGWAGRIADLMIDPSHSLSMSMSTHGTNLLQTGAMSQTFALDAKGPSEIIALDPKMNGNKLRFDIFEELNSAAAHPLERGVRDVYRRAIDNNTLIANSLKDIPEAKIRYPMENNELSPQLKLIAKLAKAHKQLGHQRQIFFVGLGGWDTHDNQEKMHPILLSRLSGSLSAFNANLEQLGLSDQVTTFTLSDFGRTLTSNGDGTDHGWGGHQMVMGGAVKGGEIYGEMPELALNSQDDFGSGRIIPSLSVEQYAAPLAKWFGLSESELLEVFPNLSRFDKGSLNFI